MRLFGRCTSKVPYHHNFELLDPWHNDVMYEGVETGGDLWRSYMSDAIHPTKKGYLEWWGPYIEEKLFEMLG